MIIILDFIIIFLLATAIIYGFVLNRRIGLIHRSRKELADLFRSFDGTILKAQMGIEDLKKVSSIVAEELQKKIDKSAMVVDELDFLSNSATKASEKLESALLSYKRIGVPKNQESISTNTINTKPLVMEQPKTGKSIIPEKPASLTKSKKALEQLLTEVSNKAKSMEAAERIQANAANTNATPNPQNILNKINLQRKLSSSEEKRQFSIASALKALGYGE